MAAVLTTTRETKTISEVADIKVTEIAPNGEGGFVRAFRFYGPDAGQPPLLEVIVTAAEKNSIAVTTPELEF